MLTDTMGWAQEKSARHTNGKTQRCSARGTARRAEEGGNGAEVLVRIRAREMQIARSSKIEPLLCIINLNTLSRVV